MFLTYFKMCSQSVDKDHRHSDKYHSVVFYLWIFMVWIFVRINKHSNIYEFTLEKIKLHSSVT